MIHGNLDAYPRNTGAAERAGIRKILWTFEWGNEDQRSMVSHTQSIQTLCAEEYGQGLFRLILLLPPLHVKNTSNTPEGARPIFSSCNSSVQERFCPIAGPEKEYI